MVSDLVSAPYTGRHCTFLSGPPGAGKTTLAVQHLRHLLQQGIPAEQILVLVPQRTLAAPFYQALHGTDWPAGGMVDVATIGGLARRTLDLFWPLVAEPAGFSRPNYPPRFLTLETTQYYMDRIVEPFIAGGGFEGITISRARLVSQIIDNLNKSAAVGFPVDEISLRLRRAWSGESARLRVYDQVQAAAVAFRSACLAQNLLDWSLQIETFWHHLLPQAPFRRYLLGGYRHLIADNVEEDIPVSHDLLRLWLPRCESALVVHDTDGGYRVFLGADPQGALALSSLCRERILLSESHVTSDQVAALGVELAAPFREKAPSPGLDPRPAVEHHTERFHPQMLDWVSERVSQLVLEEGMSPGEIAILAPFLSDALRFSLTERLERYAIPVRSHRPSRQLGEESAARCLLTLARLGHPAWLRPPPAADVAHALTLAIADLDPVRAHLLTDIVYRVRDGKPSLTPFHQIVPAMQERISYLHGGRYDELWQWLQGHLQSPGDGDAPEVLDHYLSRLFGEVLSQPGFGFHRSIDAGAVAATLIESIQKFRQSFPTSSPTAWSGEEGTSPPAHGAPEAPLDLNLEYIDLVERGVVAAQYVSSWQIRPEEAVLVVPAYTFLMTNQPVTVQFWLDAGSGAWIERIYQPLTHPYVLRRDWPQDGLWADEDEVRVQEEALGRLVLGLLRRCRQRLYLAFSELNERGYEQQGPLRHAVQRLLRRPGERGP